MVIGNGMLAKAFKIYESDRKILIFASGVSNSKTEDAEEFNREILKIEETSKKVLKDITFVYFSTCSVYDPDLSNSKYVTHKKNIEEIISHKFENYIIFRIPNIVGESSNPNTIFKYFANKLKNNEEIQIWKYAERNFIEINQLFLLVNLFLIDCDRWNKQTINIANFQNTKITFLVQAIGNMLDTKSRKIFIDRGTSYQIDLSILKSVLEEKMPDFNFLSIDLILEKYL